MLTRTESSSARVRARLSHPIVDADGHISEITPVLVDYIREVAGSKMAERYARPPSVEKHDGRTLVGSAEQRRERWMRMMPWWGGPTDALDHSTTMLPKLLNERLDDLGIDFTILYPSQGLFVSGIPEDDLRQAACRAFNVYAMDLVREYRDRMTPVAVIPMHTPEEAIAELEHAVKDLGFKAVVFQGSVRRPIPWIKREFPALAGHVVRMELFGIDSDYDYDKVWAKCVELKVAATFHGSVLAPMAAFSVSNYVYNHIGFLAEGHEKLCRALFMGGVTRRFPTLKFALLEAGVGWACRLYADIIGHWEKRNGKAIQTLDPARLDRERVLRLVVEYGDARTRARIEEVRHSLSRPQQRPENLDEFAPCRIERAEEIRDLFAPRFYFGCEADDPMTAQAFSTRINPFGAKLQPILGSDIGHWDVPVMNHVVAEAHELVERGAMSAEDFRDFTFANPVGLHASMNPDFFKGTRVEGAVAKLLQSSPSPTSPRGGRG